MSLAYNLRKLREQNQYSQAELARAVQVAQSTIAMYETGERVPNAYVLMRIANFLRVSCEELVGEQTNTEEVQMMEAEFRDALRKKEYMDAAFRQLHQQQKKSAAECEDSAADISKHWLQC